MIALNRDMLYKTLFTELNALFIKHLKLEIHQLTYCGHIRDDKEELQIAYKR
jgi:hypothetical protein